MKICFLLSIKSGFHLNLVVDLIWLVNFGRFNSGHFTFDLKYNDDEQKVLGNLQTVFFLPRWWRDADVSHSRKMRRLSVDPHVFSLKYLHGGLENLLWNPKGLVWRNWIYFVPNILSTANILPNILSTHFCEEDVDFTSSTPIWAQSRQ